MLAKDESAQKVYLALCYNYPVIAFDSMLWTYDPKQRIGQMNVPFIVSKRPAQVRAIGTIKSGIDIGEDVGVNKSRDEGATELLTKFLTLYTLILPDLAFLIGSRSEDLVDKPGEPGTLFSKIDYTVKYLPNWLKSKLHIDRTFKHFKNLDLCSVIDGEATSEHFGVGKKVTAVMLDEFGQVEPSIAQGIADNVSDVSNCVIYNSTHWYGTAHAFNKILKRKNIKIVTLPWWENPVKNAGMYGSSKPGAIELIDEAYYRKYYPEIFNYVSKN